MRFTLRKRHLRNVELFLSHMCIIYSKSSETKILSSYGIITKTYPYDNICHYSLLSLFILISYLTAIFSFFSLFSFFIYLFFRYFLKHKTKILYIVILCYKKQYSLFSVFILYTPMFDSWTNSVCSIFTWSQYCEGIERETKEEKTTNCLATDDEFSLCSLFLYILCFCYAWIVNFLIFKIKTSKNLQVNW